MASGASDKSFLPSIESLNPWGGNRSATATPTGRKDGNKTPTPKDPAPAAADHSITHLYGRSFRKYPADCPPLKVQWYHAVDVPKRKPKLLKQGNQDAGGGKAPTAPKKFSAFSSSDSKSIEKKYQSLLEQDEIQQERAPAAEHGNDGQDSRHLGGSHSRAERVPVNEDFLFDVNIEQRELEPVYWSGPVYEVRRGTWFYQEGSALRPCEENLAAQLEEGYLKTQPWLHSDQTAKRHSAAKSVTPRPSKDKLKPPATSPSTAADIASSTDGQPRTYRLFGPYINSVATYQDSRTAWLSSDGMLSWVTSSVYEKFAGGGYMSGVKLTRGFSEASKPQDKDPKHTRTPSETIPGRDEAQQRLLKRRSAPPTTGAPKVEKAEETPADGDNSNLKRQLSSFIEGEGNDSAETEEMIREREEREILDDYTAQSGETQNREIEHLVLVTHGIGQLLGLRMDSVNFIHDVNVMRKTLKSVYSNSADLKALNSELGEGIGNCRVQVLPVCWRHLLQFPKEREGRGEHDLGDIEDNEDDYPSLEDITVEGVAFARSLISDLALDVLLYQSAYREPISKIVLEETNRIVKLFKKRNPDFKGRVHLVGHSLGSAILFDILCRQRDQPVQQESKSPLRFWPAQERQEKMAPKSKELQFEFDVGDLYCLGSPIGLFQMLKGRTIAARHSPHGLPSESPLIPDDSENPFLSAAPAADNLSPITGLPLSVSSPKLQQMYNIFHPSDPISYRLEPLISPAMSSLKPQLLPYTKKGIFGNVAQQGLTGIGAKVGQSMSGFWSSLSAGIASNVINRSLGLSSDDVASMNAAESASGKGASGAGANISAGGVISSARDISEKTNERQRQLADVASSSANGAASGKDPALIDDELETLFSKFQATRAGMAREAEAPPQTDGKARKLRIEEGKVRSLNRNGRVDYSIQESVLDFNPINTIASHLAYWGDEDVNHFILSQLLSNRSKDGRDAGGSGSGR